MLKFVLLLCGIRYALGSRNWRKVMHLTNPYQCVSSTVNRFMYNKEKPSDLANGSLCKLDV